MTVTFKYLGKLIVFLLCVCVVDRRLGVAKRVLPAADRSEVAEEKEK